MALLNSKKEELRKLAEKLKAAQLAPADEHEARTLRLHAEMQGVHQPQSTAISSLELLDRILSIYSVQASRLSSFEDRSPCMPELNVCAWGPHAARNAGCAWASDRQPYVQEDPATDDDEGYGSERGSLQRGASSDGGVRSAVTANTESAGGSAAGAAGATADANGTDQLDRHARVCIVWGKRVSTTAMAVHSPVLPPAAS